MKDIMKLVQQAQEMQGQLKRIQEELAQMTLTGTSGGGMVTADVSGQGQLKRVKIDPSVVNPSDVEMLEDLVTVAVQEAQKRATEQAEAHTAKLAGGMNLPFKLPL
jgi:DNA-binding YbaB/EbfC family protein